MAINYYASSPTVVLPPQQPHSYFAPFSRSLPPNAFRPKYPTPPSINYLASTNNATAGRKRTIADVDEPEENRPAGTVLSQSPTKPRGEPIYGPGMTLIYPGEPGFSIGAESQTGTWCEEKNETKERAESRPIAISRKSQRVDSSASLDVSSSGDGAVYNPEVILDDNGTTVDMLITALGIGWKNVMTNPTLRDAARAYSRVIENHFDLTDATVMLEKDALSAYLVRAKQNGAEGYWLFADSLQWCQSVGWSLKRAVQNLTAGPIPHVEGDRLESRSRTPSAPASPNELVDTHMAIDVDAMEL